MKHLLITLLFPIALPGCSNTRTTEAPVPDTEAFPVAAPGPRHYEEIGFACGAAGEGTPIVQQFTRFIIDKNYGPIRAGLFSSRPGTAYLATISCEKLAQEKIIRLNEAEWQQIGKNRGRTDTLYTCSGCTDSRYFTLKELLDSNSNSAVGTQAGWWFDDLLKKNSDRKSLK